MKFLFKKNTEITNLWSKKLPINFLLINSSIHSFRSIAETTFCLKRIQSSPQFHLIQIYMVCIGLHIKNWFFPILQSGGKGFCQIYSIMQNACTRTNTTEAYYFRWPHTKIHMHYSHQEMSLFNHLCHSWGSLHEFQQQLMTQCLHNATVKPTAHPLTLQYPLKSQWQNYPHCLRFNHAVFLVQSQHC